MFFLGGVCACVCVMWVGKMRRWASVLVHSGCCNGATDREAHKQKIISHRSRGWEVQDQGSGRFCVSWGPASWFIDVLFPLFPYLEEGAGGLSGVSFIRTLIQFLRALPSGPHYFAEPSLPHPHPNTVTLGVRVSPCDFRRTQTFNTQQLRSAQPLTWDSRVPHDSGNVWIKLYNYRVFSLTFNVRFQCQHCVQDASR